MNQQDNHKYLGTTTTTEKLCSMQLPSKKCINNDHLRAQYASTQYLDRLTVYRRKNQFSKLQTWFNYFICVGLNICFSKKKVDINVLLPHSSL